MTPRSELPSPGSLRLGPLSPEPLTNGDDGGNLRRRVTDYLHAHHTMTIATLGEGPEAIRAGDESPGVVIGSVLGNIPHAASVFYAIDSSLRLIFLSKPSSLHGRHIGAQAAVAATITEPYDDWAAIQGVQLWGEAALTEGSARIAALAVYLARFPFVADVAKRPEMATLMMEMGVYRVKPGRVAFTDNSTGVFGREILQLVE